VNLLQLIRTSRFGRSKWLVQTRSGSVWWRDIRLPGAYYQRRAVPPLGLRVGAVLVDELRIVYPASQVLRDRVGVAVPSVRRQLERAGGRLRQLGDENLGVVPRPPAGAMGEDQLGGPRRTASGGGARVARVTARSYRRFKALGPPTRLLGHHR
jgi:hypothetical protein